MAGRKLQINGDGTMTLPSACVDDEACSGNTGREIGLFRQRHLFRKEHTFGFDSTTTPTSKTFFLYRAKAAGTIRNFIAMLMTSGSSASMTFDLKKNGTTVLAAPITVTNATGNQTAVAATLSVTTYAAGDVFTVVLTVSTSTGAQGPVSDAEFDEVAS